MAKNKIYHEQHICIGCSACASIAPQFWEMKEIKDEYKSHVVGSKAGKDDIGTIEERNIKDEEIEMNKEAAEACPVNCIHIISDGRVLNANSEMKEDKAKKIVNGEGK